MHRVDAYRMIQRRAAELGMRVKVGCHTFRATGITAYLEAGGTLENAQAMAAHESPRTTKLYDRTGDEITLDEIERSGFDLNEWGSLDRTEALKDRHLISGKRKASGRSCGCDDLSHVPWGSDCAVHVGA